MTYISEEDFKRLWNSALISVDTSALIFLQECDATLAKYAMDTLLFFGERIWISPHVAKVEMLKNLEYTGERSGPIGRLNKFNKTFDDAISNIDAKFKSMHSELSEEGHALLADLVAEIDLNKVLYDAITNFKLNVDQSTEENKSFLQSKLVQVFQNSICSKTSPVLNDEEILQIEQEGIVRYDERKPPGFNDRNKRTNKFGDLIVWKELLKKSSGDKKPILFITRDKKDDWFKITNNEIDEVREELLTEAKENNAEIFIIYFSDFIRMSLQFVSRNLEELMDKIDRQEDELPEQIEMYINDNMYGAIQEKLTDIGRFEYNSDYVDIDVIEDVDIVESSYEILEKKVLIYCKVKFRAYVEHNYHFDSREPNMELSGIMDCQVKATVNIDILTGEHNEQIKLINIESTDIELEDVEVLASTDPLGNDDDESEFHEEQINLGR
ncbi:hypothetical protein IAQ67_12630 [Paenibacillus peoriae]|uniref:PIN like domain-containing protein n=1 Tax=Paenibacillus peoriae TaxID=59893 RepID=A0A7H0YFB4_9BACL|nr:PIN-like domain-containing protein [Paenibacillus peoriae]QNR69772.1 hypothetical protein IAQ67_12630 [Paenibacillus peoriae]